MFQNEEIIFHSLPEIRSGSAFIIFVVYVEILVILERKSFLLFSGMVGSRVALVSAEIMAGILLIKDGTVMMKKISNIVVIPKRALVNFPFLFRRLLADIK